MINNKFLKINQICQLIFANLKLQYFDDILIFVFIQEQHIHPYFLIISNVFLVKQYFHLSEPQFYRNLLL